jgi:glutathione peroxidase
MSVYDFAVTTIDGREQMMADYRGRLLLVVNVASACGFTPQYAGLEALYRTYRDRGLSVLGFPCDQFGHQEPGSNEDIRRFCSKTYDVTFPMFAKIKVNGADAAPLFQWLKQQKKGLLGTEGIKWNFSKFLVDREGNVLKRYGPNDAPRAIEKDIAKILEPKP